MRDTKKTKQILARKPEGKKLLWKHRHREKDNNTWDLKKNRVRACGSSGELL
jgi:hypothetical protein